MLKIPFLRQLSNDVQKTSDALVAKEVLRILKEVSIDELNRDKRGIRIKALREHGYHTIADIAPASVHSIASIHGISEHTKSKDSSMKSFLQLARAQKSDSVRTIKRLRQQKL